MLQNIYETFFLLFVFLRFLCFLCKMIVCTIDYVMLSILIAYLFIFFCRYVFENIFYLKKSLRIVND